MADTVILRTLNQVQAALYAYFQSNNPNVLLASGAGTGPGDLLDDIGQEFGNGIYIILTFLQEIQSVNGLLRLTSGDSGEAVFLAALQAALGYSNTQMTALILQVVTDFGSNFGVTLKQATSATTNLRFKTGVFGSGTGSIPQGTTAQTAGLSPIQYATTIEITNGPLLGPGTDGLYYIDVPAQASIPGSTTRVPVGVVNQLVPPLSGFSSVTNTTASAGGLDTESYAAYLLRVQNSQKGRELGTIPGLTDFIDSQANVVSTVVVDATSPLMVRGDENQIDAWVMGSLNQTTTDTVTYLAALMNGSIILNNQPVVSVQSVLVGAVLQVPGVNYNFVKDTGGFSQSVRGTDSIVWITPPADNSVITIIYTYNQLIAGLQNLLSITTPANYLMNSDILIRAAIAVLVNITDHVVPVAGYPNIQMQANVDASVEAYFNQFLLGGTLFQNDVIDVIDGTLGVDHSEPFILFAPAGQTGAADISLGTNEYPVLNTFTFI